MTTILCIWFLLSVMTGPLVGRFLATSGEGER